MIAARVKINLIAFLVISAGLVVAMATQVLSVLKPRISVDAIFRDAGGVFTNQEVTYRGVTVGQVGEMEVVPEGVRIELRIDEGYDIPKTGIEARVMFKSAVGEQFVDLLPAQDGPPFLADGDTIPLGQTSIPVSTQELLATLEAVLRGVPPESLEGAIDALGIGLGGRGQDIATLLESGADLAELFARRAPEIEGILRSGDELGRAFSRSRTDFVAAVEDLAVVAEALAGNTGNLRRLLRGGNLMSDELVDLLRSRRAELNDVLIDLGHINDMSADHADDLRLLLANLPVALAKIVDAFEPATGLVRFGLVNDDRNPACSYGTERREPSDRSPQSPPVNAHCARGGQRRAAAPLLVPGLQAQTSDMPVLPARMADWSWSLTYLNSI